MEGETLAAGQPVVDQGGFVGAVVVEHEADIEIAGHGLVDDAEELAELDSAMPAVALTDHLARSDVEGGEERRGGDSRGSAVLAFPDTAAGSVVCGPALGPGTSY